MQPRFNPLSEGNTNAFGLGVTIGEAEAVANGEDKGDGENKESGDDEALGLLRFFSFKNTDGAQPAKGRRPRSLKKPRLSIDSRM